MPATGRLPGPLRPQFPKVWFQLMSSPVYQVKKSSSVEGGTPSGGTPDAPPTPDPAPQPGPKQDSDPTKDWTFSPFVPKPYDILGLNPLARSKATTAILEDIARRQSPPVPRGYVCEPLEPTSKEPNSDDDSGWQVQISAQSTQHWRFPNSKNFGPVLENAVVTSMQKNWPLHSKGKRGFELQLALTYMYDFYYLNDRQQSLEAFLDHSPLHAPTNLQQTTQLSYLWPFFVDGSGDSLLDVSVQLQISPAINWQYDYDAQRMLPGPQLQFAGGLNIVFKPAGHLKKDDPFYFFKNTTISIGTQGGATLGAPNTGDLSRVLIQVTVPF